MNGVRHIPPTEANYSAHRATIPSPCVNPVASESFFGDSLYLTKELFSILNIENKVRIIQIILREVHLLKLC